MNCTGLRFFFRSCHKPRISKKGQRHSMSFWVDRSQGKSWSWHASTRRGCRCRKCWESKRQEDSSCKWKSPVQTRELERNSRTPKRTMSRWPKIKREMRGILLLRSLCSPKFPRKWTLPVPKRPLLILRVFFLDFPISILFLVSDFLWNPQFPQNKKQDLKDDLAFQGLLFYQEGVELRLQGPWKPEK